MLRAALGTRNPWWSIAGATMVILGSVMVLIVMLVALGVIPTH
jgi:hypothetical protein